jgi:hypothetical protein
VEEERQPGPDRGIADTVLDVEARFDVFLSFSGEDRHRIDELAGALKQNGLRPFVDDREIRFAHSITGDIEQALRASKTMLVYYSASFPLRTACQFELRHAYLSALRADEVQQRILVINPADPETGHLMPLEMRAHRYWKTWHSKRELDEVVSRIKSAADALDSPFPGIDFTARATVHHGPSEPTAGYVGRYRDRWAIHSALHRADHPLTETVTSRSVASLTGMTGIGKTSLAKVYVHDYGFLYPGGVYWTDLTGAGGSAERTRQVHSDRLAGLAERLGSPLGEVPRRRLLDWWDRHLRHGAGPALWVVDAVPADTPPDVLAELVPRAEGVRTLLIGQRELPREFAEPVRLTGLTEEDGRELFSACQASTAPEETDAVDEVVRKLGGHPYAIRFAAAAARGREGLWRLRDRVDHLTTDAGVLDHALTMACDAVKRRRGPERVVLALSAVCAPDPIPAALIRDVIGALEPAARDQTAAVLSGLDRDMLVEHVGTAWQVHLLVREAARQSVAPDELDAIAAVTARRLLALAELGTPALAEHARTLITSTTGSADLSVRLNKLVARHHDGRGEPGLAAEFHENLYRWEPGRPDHLLAAARSRLEAGHHDRALEHARQLAELATDDLLRMRAECVRAAVLDARTRHREAEPSWARMVNSAVLATAPPAERIAVRTAHIRNRRALGHFTEAASLARRLVAEFGERFAEQLIGVRLELVAIGMATDDRIGARAVAQEIVDHYQRLGLPGHVNAVEAAALLYEATLEVHILEQFPSRADQVNAEAELRKLVASAGRSFGEENPRTWAVTVAHLRTMVGLGSPERTLAEYVDLPKVLAAHLGTDHRLYLRAVFLLGQAHAQRHDLPAAATCYQTALAGQEVVLGPGHPETLRARYELGVTWWRQGDCAAARQVFDSVRRDAVNEVGRHNDLYGQALTGSVLSRVVPGFAVQAVDWLERRRRTKPES